MSELTALILCGGLGSRLRSVVADQPKSMAPIAARPFLEIQIGGLKAQGIRRFVLATGYLSQQIEDHFGDGARYGLEILYSRETEPLGTGGAMRLACEKLSNPVLILNGDSFCEFDLKALRQCHAHRDAQMVMVVRRLESTGRYGRVSLSGDLVTGFEEKKDGSAGWINAGIYLCQRAQIEAIPSGRAVSFEREVLPAQAASGRCHAVEAGGIFIDIGIPEDFARAQTLLSPYPGLHFGGNGSR